MNDLPFIFYRPRDMYLDTIGMSKEGKVAHRQLADYVWINDGPPANDNDILREIANCAASDWGRVKRELVGKGWVENPKFFLHKGIVKTLNYSKEKAVESYNKTCTANRLPRRSLLPPDPETGVTHYVTPNVKTDVTRDVTPTNRNREGNRETTHTQKAGAGVMEKLRATLNKTYRRGESDAWSNIEETTLFDISKRPGATEELEHILLFRSKMQGEDRRRFFPQSLYALLDRWTETLDKARVQCPIKPKKPVEFPLKKAIAEKPISIEDLQSSLEWTRANTPNATEVIATLERRIKEMSK